MNSELSELTSAQEQRYHSLLTTYGHAQALAIVKGLTNRGKNSYSTFITNADAIAQAKHDDQAYFDEIYNKIELGKPISPGAIIQTMCDIRKSLELEAYKAKLKLRCEGDFFMLFVFSEEVQEIADANGKVKRTIVSYTPLAKARPDSM
jgi:hypothetical protein